MNDDINGATTAPHSVCRDAVEGQATILPFERLRASPRRRERGFTGRASLRVVAFPFNDGLVWGCTSNARRDPMIVWIF
jgi:hypothetical protein